MFSGSTRSSPEETLNPSPAAGRSILCHSALVQVVDRGFGCTGVERGGAPLGTAEGWQTPMQALAEGQLHLPPNPRQQDLRPWPWSGEELSLCQLSEQNFQRAAKCPAQSGASTIC